VFYKDQYFKTWWSNS